VWSTAAIGTDYLEKTWQQAYRGEQRTYDYEGVVADGYPLLQKIPDVNEPASGYLWGNLAAHGKTYYHFGEFIATTFCGDIKAGNPQQGPMLPGQSCASKEIAPGEALPDEWGGGRNKWPWRLQHRYQAGACGSLCAGGAGLRPGGSGPDPRRHFHEALEAVGCGQRAGQRYDAQLRDAAAGQRPHGRNAARRTHAEIVGGR
jgi:hypothetical protein